MSEWSDLLESEGKARERKKWRRRGEGEGEGEGKERERQQYSTCIHHLHLVIWLFFPSSDLFPLCIMSTVANLTSVSDHDAAVSKSASNNTLLVLIFVAEWHQPCQQMIQVAQVLAKQQPTAAFYLVRDKFMCINQCMVLVQYLMHGYLCVHRWMLRVWRM